MDADFTCRCGAVAGTLHQATPASLCHVVCYCRDCRAFARHLGAIDQLEPGGGSALVQVLPARLEFVQGQDKLACLKLSPKGMKRWYTACCNTPFANTPGSARVPLVSLWCPNFSDSSGFGPVSAYSFTKMALPGHGAPARDKGLLTMLGGLLRRGAVAYMTGTARRNPFFDDDGAPIAAPRLISKEERAAAYAE